jgi:hypothetical protein
MLCQLASRFKANTVDPSFVVRLDVESAGACLPSPSPCPRCGKFHVENELHGIVVMWVADATVSSTYFQSDFANMARFRDKLDAALAELQKPHSKRIARYIR